MEHSPKRKSWKYVLRLLVSVAALEVGGLVGLVCLRLFVSPDVPLGSLLPHPIFSPIAIEPSEFDPNLGWYPPTEMFGRRRQELPPKTPNEVRVFLLGGSTVWGEGAEREDQTIAKRLEVYLNSAEGKRRLGGTAHVYNEGVRGYYSKQELILLITKVIPFQQPDLVIILDGVNDFIVNAVHKPHIDRPYSDAWHFWELQLTRSLDSITSPIGAMTNAAVWTVLGSIRNTFIGNFIDQGVRLKLPPKRKFGLVQRLVMGLTRRVQLEPTHPVSEEARRYYLGNMAMVKHICEGARARFFWFAQPALFLKAKKTSGETISYNRHREFWSHMRSFYEMTFKREAPANFGAGGVFHDISDSLTLVEGTAYVDQFHYAPAAQDVIARRIAEAILR